MMGDSSVLTKSRKVKRVDLAEVRDGLVRRSREGEEPHCTE